MSSGRELHFPWSNISRAEGYDGVVWDENTQRYTFAKLGPKGSTVEEKGVLVEGDMGPGNVDYAGDSDWYQLPAEQIPGAIEGGKKANKWDVRDLLHKHG